jgi:hypothetical protein
MRVPTQPSSPSRSRLALVWLGAGLLCVLLMAAPASATTPFDDTTWNLVGTGSVRIGSVNQTVPVSGTLVLNADRTFTLTDSAQQGAVPEEGVWFVNRNRIVFFPQNFLDQIVELEDEISAELNDGPVEISLLRYFEQASTKNKNGTNALSFQEKADFDLFVVNMNQSFRMSIRIAATGTQVP